MSDIAIRVESLGKRYRLGERFKYKTLRDSLARAAGAPFRAARNLAAGRREPRREEEWLWALKDVSFELRQGEALGIIGRNGAGKTTLLKVLSRITAPTEGYAELHGRVGSLLEVGTGFHPELTGRENVFLNGAIIGMHRAEIERKFDEIVAFAEVERFIDTPVKFYSSGMFIRLAFAVAAHLEPEILMVDEVLAVGDAAFQKKCMGKMGDIARGGRTVVFVSHNMSAVENLCGLGLLLDRGRLVTMEPVDQVVSLYLRQHASSAADGEVDRRMHVGPVEDMLIERVVLHDADGNPGAQLRIGEPCTLEITFRALKPLKDIRIGFGVNSVMGTRLSARHHTDYGAPLFAGSPGRYRLSFAFTNPFLPGIYVIGVGAHRALGGTTIAYVPEALRFDVVEVSADDVPYEPYNAGLIDLRGQWTRPASVD